MANSNSYPISSETHVSPYYRTQSSGGTIYFREESGSLLRDQLDKDIQSSGQENFTTKHALVTTFIYVNRRFQVALATDNLVTYAVFNYEQLDGYRADAPVALNEPGCTQNKVLLSSINANLLNGSNTEIRGRYVFNLTKIDCYRQASGIKVVQFSTTRYGGLFHTIGYNVKVLDLNENGKMAGHITEYVVERSSKEARTVTLLSANQISNNGLLYTVFGIFDAYKNFKRVTMKNLFVFEDTRKSATFNYGKANLTVGYGIKCTNVLFEEHMSAKPSIKLTAQLANSNMENYVNVWLVNASTRGFSVCAKEIIEFSGNNRRLIVVHYVAVVQSFMGVTEVEHINHTTSEYEDVHCVKKSFTKNYIVTPSVFQSIEKLDDMMYPVTSWIQNISRADVQVCYQTTRGTHNIHVLVAGRLNPCTESTCPDHLQCYFTNGGRTPYCGCINNCNNDRELCGSDFKTYKSVCHLNQQHCYRYGPASKTNVTISHYGKCVG